MFSYTSQKNPLETETVGERRARKARDKEESLTPGSLTSMETRSTTSSNASIASRSSEEEWTPWKILVTRSFSVRISANAPGRSEDAIVVELIPDTIVPLELQNSRTSEQEGDESRPSDRVSQAYDTECTFAPDARYLLPAHMRDYDDDRDSLVEKASIRSYRDDAGRYEDIPVLSVSPWPVSGPGFVQTHQR